jgi:hypothetical protein
MELLSDFSYFELKRIFVGKQLDVLLLELSRDLG